MSDGPWRMSRCRFRSYRSRSFLLDLALCSPFQSREPGRQALDHHLLLLDAPRQERCDPAVIDTPGVLFRIVAADAYSHGVFLIKGLCPKPLHISIRLGLEIEVFDLDFHQRFHTDPG